MDTKFAIRNPEFAAYEYRCVVVRDELKWSTWHMMLALYDNQEEAEIAANEVIGSFVVEASEAIDWFNSIKEDLANAIPKYTN